MQKKVDYIEFEKEIRNRGIEYLVHFTPTINLYSIYEQGKLLSRALLEKYDIEQTDIFDYVEFTDPVRYDDKSYINLSIQHPNTVLFHKFVKKTQSLPQICWCVLKIDTKYIYHKDTLFSVTNAANSYNKNYVRITGNIEKFRMMFEPSLKIVTSYNSRIITRNELLSNYPTDEQAEVLVKDEIPISDIIEVCFRNNTELASTKAALNMFDISKLIVDEKIFLKTRI